MSTITTTTTTTTTTKEKISEKNQVKFFQMTKMPPGGHSSALW